MVVGVIVTMAEMEGVFEEEVVLLAAIDRVLDGVRDVEGGIPIIPAKL